jgi:hypothetical protein
MSALREDWQVLLSLFPSDWEELGRSTGAVTRLRGFDSLNDLLRTLLLHVGCGWSLRETAVQAKLAGIADVSDVTLLNRLRQAEDWLRQLCQQLFREGGIKLESVLKDRPVRLVDATTVKEPGKTGGNGESTTVCGCPRWSAIISNSRRYEAARREKDWHGSSYRPAK